MARAARRAADPYRVWLSEIMLQQTTVTAVAPYYARFLGRWSDVRALAAAPLEEVLKAWAGLGYYARARNLHACARAVVEHHGGEFPASEAALRALPGIGDYTAAAIAAIAFERAGEPGRRQYRARDRAAVCCDGTASARKAGAAPACSRAYPATACRRFCASDDGPRRHHLHAEKAGLRAVSLEPGLCGARDGRRRDFSTPNAEARRRAPPGCGLCCVPGRWLFAACERGQRKGLLGGMTEVPTTEWLPDFDEATALESAPRFRSTRRRGAAWRRLPGVVRHVFTHFPLELSVYLAELPARTPAPAAMRWVAVRGYCRRSAAKPDAQGRGARAR